MDSILEMYLYETESLLEQLDSIALAAEQVNTFSQSNVDEIFRIMHTIKGSSAMMEFTPLMSVAHRIEDLFFIIRENGMQIVSEDRRGDLFDLFFQATDYFRNEVEKLKSNEPLSADIDNFLSKINTLVSKIQGDLNKSSQNSEVAASIPATSNETSLPALHPDYPYSILVRFDQDSGMESLRAFLLISAIRETCSEHDFIFTPSDVENNADSSDLIVEQGFLIEFRNFDEREHAIHIIGSSGSVQSFQTHDASESPVPIQEAPVLPQEVAVPAMEVIETPAYHPTLEKSAPPPTSIQPSSNKESFISVSLSKLDQLMAVVGEIVITESMVTDSPDLNGLALDNFTKSARQLRKLTDELQDVSMSLRMVPVSSTFQKMNRIVRDMGKKLGKRVKLTLVGEETEVDKTIVDGISDSIMHIVRNSMDHGIETSEEERLANRKDPIGEIILSARHTGSEVIIEIKDDGQGINYERVLQKALAQGLASPDVEYSNREITNFLLMPGFSTSANVTEFSGRGVGMDVVRRISMRSR